MSSAALEKIEEVLASMRPYVVRDGGDIELVSYKGGVVSLRLLGACVSCPLSMLTLKMGIEERLKESVPEIVEVVRVD